mmetsp:Transcript_46971/g.42060  ORF Transcript_46971/g.42060 Transcript_46971/m.42060 type:complete len:320 (+) Transcript_46971:28-987(+)
MSLSKPRESYILEDKPFNIGNTPMDDNDNDNSDESSSDSSIEPGAIHLSTPKHRTPGYVSPQNPSIPISEKRETMRSKAIQRSLSKHITMSNLRITKRSHSAISHTDHDDIWEINTNFADEMRVFCGCCNIYNMLYFISFYHLFMSIPLLCIGFILFDIHVIADGDNETEHVQDLGIMDTTEISESQKEMIVFGIYITFGLLRFITFALGIYLIPKFKYENLAMLHSRLYRYYKRLVKIWMGLLLLSPLLYDVLLVIEYIDDMKSQTVDHGDHETEQHVDLEQNHNEMLFVLIVFLMELLSSIYFFFIIHGFTAIKWPK